MQNVEHQDVMGQPQNQTIMITSNQPQTPQQTPQTPPIQSVRIVDHSESDSLTMTIQIIEMNFIPFVCLFVDN